MSAQLTTARVWESVEKELFAVVGMVTSRGEARTAGVVYAVQGRRLYVATSRESWKARHIAANEHVSVTIPIAKRIPLLPWIRIPAATITFSGRARVRQPSEGPAGILKALFRGMAEDKALMAESCIIEIVPQGDFMTYGVGIPLLQMRHREKARGRVPVGVEAERPPERAARDAQPTTTLPSGLTPIA